MGGFNLPPGVSVSDIPGNRPEDLYWEWIAEGVRHRCGDCGGFLRFKPDCFVDWEEGVDCDGKPRAMQFAYEEGTIAILGEEYRGKTYTVHFADCGEECGPDGHKPHRHIEMAGRTNIHRCRKCGKRNEIGGM